MIRGVLGAGVVIALGAGCKADLPPLTDAKGMLDVMCTGPHADLLVDVFPSSLANASAVLGAPDDVTMTLAMENIVTVGFVGLGAVTDAAGSDIRIVAMVDAGGAATVRVAGSDMEFVYSGDLNASTNEIDIAVADLDLNAAIYARIIGVAGTIQIDAVQAVHDTCQ